MITALVEFLDAKHGGRNSPPMSGFRPQIAINGVHTSCTVESAVGTAVFDFGITHKVLLKLLHPSYFPDALPVGTAVQLFEASKLIALGEVVAGPQHPADLSL